MARVDLPYVEWVRVEGYLCIKSADLHLTRLHALIGPNDSGKSSLLRAIALGRGKFWVPGAGGWLYNAGEWTKSSYPEWLINSQGGEFQNVVLAAAGARAVLRLDPDAMRIPVELIPQGAPLWFRDEKGTGTPALYDALLSRDIAAFSRINEQFRTLFPTVRALRLHNASAAHKQLGLTLVDGTEVGPSEMSEGMLYWLAFAIIDHLSKQSIILIEEPENGLHPARIVEVVRILREVSKRTQIILATHSPLVINELQPEEVTIVTRSPERGSICTPMKDTKNFETRSKVYALGELWVSYADGDFERGLVSEQEISEVKLDAAEGE